MSAKRQASGYHVVATMAHVHGLAETGALDAEEANAILAALADAAAEGSDTLCLAEDVVERLEVGRGAHDQRATEVRLWTRDVILDTASLLVDLRQALTDLAGRSGSALAPGVQPAVLFGHYLLAYVEQFYRDGNRLKEVYVRADILPLGAGDGAGVEIAFDRGYVARLLGMHANTRNSVDGVGDRDFTVEYLAALAMVTTRAARLLGDLGRFSGGSSEDGERLAHVESLARAVADDWRTAALALTGAPQGVGPALSAIDLATPGTVERAHEALHLAIDAVRVTVPPGDAAPPASRPLDRFVSRGGTAPVLVRAAVDDTINRIDTYRRWIAERRAAHATVEALRHFPACRT